MCLIYLFLSMKSMPAGPFTGVEVLPPFSLHLLSDSNLCV